MTLDDAISLLEAAIPDETVQEALMRILQQCAKDDLSIDIEFEELPEGHISVPITATVEIVTKGFVEMYHGQAFGTFEAQVAIGGVVDDGDVTLKAGYCFATLFFNAERKCFTIDFHLEMR